VGAAAASRRSGATRRAIAEVEAAEELPTGDAQREHHAVDRHQEAVHRLAARGRRSMARFHVHMPTVVLRRVVPVSVHKIKMVAGGRASW
jgi:hypothetical protein